MTFGVLALDYDGTIAIDGALDPDVRAAIADVRAAGVVVVLVTGRILDDLRRVAGDLRFVDPWLRKTGPCSPILQQGIRWCSARRHRSASSNS